MDTTHVFHWDGRYFGFVSDGNLFDQTGKYCGWVDDSGRVWRASGSYLGDLIEGRYVLRRLDAVRPTRRAARVHLALSEPPAAPVDQPGREPKDGWTDPLGS
jgi:hypothetical protein